MFSADDKRRLASEALALRAQGLPFRAVSEQLDVNECSLRRWMRAAQGLLPVKVVEERKPQAGLSLISPAGFRVDGLDLDQAAALLRRLSS